MFLYRLFILNKGGQQGNKFNKTGQKMGEFNNKKDAKACYQDLLLNIIK